MSGSLDRKEFAPGAKCPLDGIRVLDLSRVVAGNALSVALADFGAEVIKIESPGKGDDLRNWKVKGVSTSWKVYSRNKKSVSLNLRDDRAKRILLDLVKDLARVRREFPPGPSGEDGAVARHPARGQPEPGDRPHFRLGPGRPLQGTSPASAP